MSGLLGGLLGGGGTSGGGVVPTLLTSILGPQPSAPPSSGSGSSGTPATGSSVTVPASSSPSTPGAGMPYGGQTGTLVAAAYDTKGVPTVVQIFFPSLSYTATFLSASIAVTASS